MRSFVDEYELDEFEHVADRASDIWQAFGVSAQPSFVFINDNGRITRHIGGLAVEELTEELELLVAT